MDIETLEEWGLLGFGHLLIQKPSLKLCVSQRQIFNAERHFGPTNRSTMANLMDIYMLAVRAISVSHALGVGRMSLGHYLVNSDPPSFPPLVHS